MASQRPASTVCIALIVGLPGSGKTTFADFLKHEFSSPERVEPDVTLNVIHIRYDEMITPEVNYRTKIDVCSNKCTTARHEVMTVVEKLVFMLKDSPAEGSGHKIVVKAGSDNQFVKVTLEWELVPLHRTLIIIDDNTMCVSSMRYSYFELARRHSVSFCQVYLEAVEDEAQLHNKSRAPEEVIPDNVFRKISLALEPPESKPWEKHSLVLPAFESFRSESAVSAVKALISKAFLDPEEPIGDWNHIDESTRNACMATIISQADVAMKNFVSKKLKKLRDNGVDADEARAKSRMYDRCRAEVLEGIKTREIVVPNDIYLMFQCDHPLANFRLRTFLKNKLFPKGE